MTQNIYHVGQQLGRIISDAKEEACSITGLNLKVRFNDEGYRYLTDGRIDVPMDIRIDKGLYFLLIQAVSLDMAIMRRNKSKRRNDYR